MSEYADIRLVECNRQQSIQGTSGNDTEPSHFTCRLGNTMDLKAGDTVEILNAFISQDGCGGENIDLKGESIKDGFGNPITQTYEYTRLEVDYWNKDTMNYAVDQPLNRVNKRVRNTKGEPINEVITKEIKDNEINVEQSYYITANAENYYSYPRSYLWDGATSFDKNLTDTYEYEDGYMTGGTASNVSVSSGLNKGAPLKESLIASCDYFLTTQGGNMGFPSVVASEGNQILFYKPIIDNQRYTLFARTTSYANPTDPNFPPYFQDLIEKLNPLLVDFTEYKELKTLKLPAGYISQNAVAERITEQLQEVYEFDEVNKKELTQPQVFSSWDGYRTGGLGNVGHLPMRYDFQPITDPLTYNMLTPTLQTYSTETYKPFECWSPLASSKVAYDLWTNYLASELFKEDYPSFLSKTFLYEINQWFQQSQWIYVKRPEIFKAGRKINNPLGFSNETGDTDTPVFMMITNELADNQTIGSIDPATHIRDSYETSYEWTTENLNNFRDLFIEQKKYYKDLIEDKIGDNREHSLGVAVFSDLYDEARFLHGSRLDNSQGVASTYGRIAVSGTIPYQYPISGLGNDGYRGEDQTHLSTPLFFAYQSKNATKLTSGENPTDLCYGAMFKKKVGDKFYIVFRNDLIKWIDFNLFDNSPVATPKIMLANKRCIGWDWHARSYGNVVLSGTSGYLTQNIEGNYYYGKESKIPTGEKPVVPPAPEEPEFTANNFINRYTNIDADNILRYVGANNPSLSFDPVSQRFGWKSLHTAENTGQDANAGSEHTKRTQHPAVPPAGEHGGSAGWTETTITGVPLNPQASTEVYKINKRLRYNCFCPDAKPYRLNTEGELSSVSTGGTRSKDAFDTKVIPANRNMKLGTVFDSHCGIYLNFANACPKEYWDRSLIGILGFTWEQYNPTFVNRDNNRLARITNNNRFELPLATTNSQIVSTDLKQYPMNIWGGITYSTQVPVPIIVPLSTTTGNDGKTCQFRPTIVEQTESIILRSQGTPKLMSRPYFTIRTDLLDSSEYTGGLSGGLKMPIIGIVDKMSGEGDYFFTEAGGMSFTLSHDRHISSITTSIHDPNGELARVDLSSAVIYKISRVQNTSRFDIVKQILEEQNVKK